MAKYNILVDQQVLARLNKMRQSASGPDSMDNALDAALNEWEVRFGVPPGYTISLADIGAASGSKPGDPNWNILCDLTGDGRVNVADAGIGAAIGIPATTPPPPPPPPPPVGTYSVDQLIADSVGVNDGACCPPVNSYDWGQRGHGLTGKVPTGDQITGWGTAQWLACGASKPGVRLQVRNGRVLGLRSNGTWVNFGGNITDWCSATDPNTTSNYTPPSGTPGDWAMPQGQRALHWGTHRLANIQGLLGVVTIYEAKGDGCMCNAGFDDISGGNIKGDVFISKYKKVRPDVWTPIGGSSVTAENLRRYPPPGLVV